MDTLDKRAVWPGWETVRLIGQGSFGAVYEIRRNVYGSVERAALKHIAIPQNASDLQELRANGYPEEDIAESYREYLESIVAEYTLMRKLDSCPNVVRCEDILTQPQKDGIGWDIRIKMELLTPLSAVLERCAPEALARRVGMDMCRALVLCRKYNIVHRDIKPANIFVSENGDFKLGDFGIAKTVEKTSGGTKIGTYNFMSPEVFHGEPYGHAADVYSLGLVLYWLLNERRLPFLPMPPERIRAAMEEQARRRRFDGEPLPPPAHGSEALKRVVLKACAYDLRDRYKSAEELLWALENPEKASQSLSKGAGAAYGREGARSPSGNRGGAASGGQVHKPSKGKSLPILLGCLAGAAVLALILLLPRLKDKGSDASITPLSPSTAPTSAPVIQQAEDPAAAPVTPEAEDASTGAGAVEIAEGAAEETHQHTWAAATCTEPEICTVCGEERGAPLGHSWGSPSYEWASDNSSVIARRVCQHDPSHVETEAVWTSSTVASAATCTVKGSTRYTASFSNSAFSTQTKTVENIPAAGHSWGSPSYTWSSDNSSVTAKRVCRLDASHVETETVRTSSTVVSAATCTAKGSTRYTASFSNSAFSTQTKTVENISALGHSWGSPSYTWSSDNSSVTAKCVCRHDASHVQTETARTSSTVVSAATCTANGSTRYTASFSNSAFSTQTKTVQNISALGHSWRAATYSSPETCTRCGTTRGTALQKAYTNASVWTNAQWAADYDSEYSILSYSWKGAAVPNGTQYLEVPSDYEIYQNPRRMRVHAEKGNYIFIMPIPETGHGVLGTVPHQEYVTVIADRRNDSLGVTFYFFVTDSGKAGWNNSKYFLNS